MLLRILLLLFPMLAYATSSIVGEVLYWTARENGLTILYDSTGSSCFVDWARARNPDFNFDVGFRLGLGHQLRHSPWEVTLQYTHFHNYTHTCIEADNCHVLFPVWLNSAATCRGYVTEANARWRLHYGNLDFNFERAIAVGRRLTLTPLMGLRGTIARQKYRILYSGGTLFPCATDKVHMKNKFWGIGPLAGTRGDLQVAKHFSLYGNVSLALLYGHFYVHQSEFVWCDRRLRVFDRFYLPRAIADFALGIRGKYKNVSGHLGWEEHLLFGQNQLIRFVDHDVPGASVSLNDDLTLSGLVAGLRVDF
jgi:hypothetical protein